MADAWARRERRLVFFAAALLIPVLLLTGLSVAAIRNDQVAYEYFQAKGQRDLLDQLVWTVEELIAERRERLFEQIEKAVRSGKLQSDELKAITDADSSIQGLFCVDASHKRLYPNRPWPYARSRGDGDANPQRLQDSAARARIEAQLATLPAAPAPRLLSLQRIKSSETPGSEAWARIRFEEALCLRALERKAEAIQAFIETGQCPRAGSHDGRCLRLESAIAHLDLLSSAEQIPQLRNLSAEMMSGAFQTSSRRAWRQAWDRIGEVLAMRLSEDSTLSEFIQARERWRGDLAWQERLSQELEPILANLSADPSAQGELSRQVTRQGEEPLLLCYRPVPTKDGLSHLFIGFVFDLEKLTSAILDPRLRTLRVEPGLAFSLTDNNGVLLAQGGASALLRIDLPMATRRPDSLPFWRLTVVRDPKAFQGTAFWRAMVLVGLIALALTGVAFGASATFRFVHQSLELARLKADFLSSITHELKTPLTSIQMFSEMLSLGRVRSDEKRQQYYKHIQSESIRLRGMIDDILEFARSESGKVHYVLAESDLAQLARDGWDLFNLSAEAQGFESDLQLPDFGALPPVDVDREAMLRVLVNLLSNAVKYSLEDKRLSLKVQREGDELALSVTDHGVGIDLADQARIFEKFFRAGDPLTREVSGTGLGLSLVDAIVRAHGGRITVRSARGEGSTFTVFLPIVTEYRSQWPPLESITSPDSSSLNGVTEPEANS